MSTVDEYKKEMFERTHNPEYATPTSAPSDTADAGRSDMKFNGLPETSNAKKL